MVMNGAGFAIFLNGSYGVGKSSALEHLADRFAAAELPFSLFDVDWFHRSWPPAADDPRNVLVEAENMRAVWANYARAGARTPIVAGVVETAGDLERYERVFGMPLRLVLLTASDEVAERRLRGRYDADRAAALAWHLDDRARLAAALEQAPEPELRIDTDGRSPAEVAAIVFDRFAAAPRAAGGSRGAAVADSLRPTA